MIIPDYKQIARSVPELRCFSCKASNHDMPIYSPKFMGQNPEEKPAPIPGKDFCLPCWETAFDQEPRVIKLKVINQADGSRSSKQESVELYDQRQRETADGFVSEGHPWPHAPGSLLPPKISSNQLAVDLADLASDFLRRGGVVAPWMLDTDTTHPRTSKIFKHLPEDSQEVVKTLLKGKVPKMGLVLGGPSRAGKTGAIASWIVAWAINHLRRVGPLRGESKVDDRRASYQNTVFAWLNWLHAYPKWRKACDQELGLQAVDHYWEPLAKIPLLVLDDLGAETPMPFYGALVVEGVLERLIDARNAAGLITLATTNLNEADLRTYLGERTANRLLDINPFVSLPENWDKLSGRRE